MQTITVKDLMVPLGDYATVSQEATLGDAVAALEAAQNRVEADREKFRAVLVLDRQGRVVGKLDQWSVLWALEPRYKQMGDLKDTSRFGFSPEFLRSMVDYYELWRKPLEGLCAKAAKTQVKDIMLKPTEGEQVEADATLDTAIHLLVMGRHQSLLVRRGGDVVGILRLSDVFKRICDGMKACKL